MRPTPKQLAWAFFAYFAAISALGSGFHFWPALGCHDPVCHAAHGHAHTHAHKHAHDEPGEGCPTEHEPGPAHDHDNCLACQYYAQTLLAPATAPELTQAFLCYQPALLARQLPAAAQHAPYEPRGPPHV